MKVKILDDKGYGYTATHLNYAYKLHKDRMNWKSAEKVCQSEGGHLASVKDGEVNDELSKIAANSYSVWLGGRRMLGEYSWSDNSTWWNNSLNTKDIKIACVAWTPDLMDRWSEYDCEEKIRFICQIEFMEYQLGRSTETLSLEFEKDQLSPFTFQVWYSYKVANQQFVDTWDEKEMTGLRLSWRIENPSKVELTADTNVIGDTIKTPGFDAISLEQTSDYVFDARLLLPYDILQAIENATLVIELDVNKGPRDEAVYGFKGDYHQLYREKKTWKEARAHCNQRHGRLASIFTEEEQVSATIDANWEYVWLGGSWRNGQWQWVQSGTPGCTDRSACSGRNANSLFCSAGNPTQTVSFANKLQDE